MGEAEIDFKQRVNLVCWHAMSCPDGTRKLGKPWKKEMANRAGISQSLVTKMSQVAARKGAIGFKKETMRQLCALKDEAFLGILGFKDKAKSTPAASSAPNQRWVIKFIHAASPDDYVDLCIEYGVAVVSELMALARSRAEVRERQHIEATARWRADEAAYWFVPCSEKRQPEVNQVPMHRCEVEEIHRLFRALTSSATTSKTTIVHALPYCGIAHALQQVLPTCEGFNRYYRGGVHHLHIGALEYTSDARSKLSKHLLVRSGDDDDDYRQWSVEKKIARQLHNLNQMLIIHGASAIPEDALRFLRKLSDELEVASDKQIPKGVSRFILTAWKPGAFGYFNNRRPVLFDYRVSVSSEDALKYFNEALEHYRVIRGRASHKIAGPRAENSNSEARRASLPGQRFGLH